MADKLKVENNNEKSFVNKAADFIVKNKLAIIVASAAVVLAVVLIVVCSSISSSSKDKAMIRLADLEDRYNKYIAMSDSDADYEATFNALVEDLKKEVKKNSYPSEKSAYLLGQMYYSKDDMNNAYDWYMKCHDLNPDVYLASLGLFNAAVCKENSGAVDEALELYKKASEHIEVKAHALFSVGRIYLEKNEIDLAKSTFQVLVDDAAPSEYKALAENILATL